MLSAAFQSVLLDDLHPKLDAQSEYVALSRSYDVVVDKLLPTQVIDHNSMDHLLQPLETYV